MTQRLKIGITVIIIAMVFCLILIVVKGNRERMEEKNEKQDRGYTQITPEEAKEMMDSDYELVVLDVRTKEEYEEGHIEEAVLLPLDEIETAPETLTDMNQTILVYCHSGRRSKAAAYILSELGYTNIYEFGGIVEWPYDVVS